MVKTVKSKIVEAFESNNIVWAYRENLEVGKAHGYVDAIGKDFFILNCIDGSIRFDGYNCMRFKDITKCVSPAPHVDFTKLALKKRKLKRQKVKGVDPSSLTSLIESAAKQYQLLVIHFEVSDPDICYIGKLLSVSKTHISLLEVTPDGTWSAKARQYKLSEITRVDFGGGYEEALSLVAGQPKQWITK
jgi:hypothetical protein